MQESTVIAAKIVRTRPVTVAGPRPFTGTARPAYPNDASPTDLRIHYRQREETGVEGDDGIYGRRGHLREKKGIYVR